MNTYLFVASNKHKKRYLKYTIRKTLAAGRQQSDKNVFESAATQHLASKHIFYIAIKKIDKTKKR